MTTAGMPAIRGLLDLNGGGMEALPRQLAIEWSKRGIRVNSLAPCQFLTPGLRAVMEDPQLDFEKLNGGYLAR